MNMNSSSIRISLVCAAIAALVLIVASPLALEPLGKALITDSEFVSRVGSSYGAISALISAISLFILSIGSVLQARQTQIARLQSARMMQLELLKLSLQNPAYRLALGDEFGNKSAAEWRIHAYQNLWVMHFQMAFITGAIEEAGLRAWLQRELFGSQHGMDFWQKIRSSARAEASTPKHRQFIDIVDGEFSRANAKRTA